MVVVFYTSGHGFGHASRDLEVMRELSALDHTARIIVRTSVPEWFFGEPGIDSVEVQAFDADVGVVQIDSLRMDTAETARRAALFYGDFAMRAESEASFLRHVHADVVVGDVPPLAFAAAALAEVPSVLLANFTWDWIYGGFTDFERLAPGVIHQIARAYGDANLALRLPLHGGFDSVTPVIRDIPLIARASSLGRIAARRRLGIDGRESVVLASFGRYGVRLPYDTVVRKEGLTVLLTDDEANPAVQAVEKRIVALSRAALQERGLRYPDLVAAADVVVTKPGYGIVSECIANDTAMLYTTRGDFLEYDVFDRELPAILRCRRISQTDLLSGNWAPDLEALLQQPEPPRRLTCDGAAIAAKAISEIARA